MATALKRRGGGPKTVTGKLTSSKNNVTLQPTLNTKPVTQTYQS